jgi:hypothetical protein
MVLAVASQLNAEPLCCVSSTPGLHGVAPGRSDRWTLGRHRPLVAGASVYGEPGQVGRGLPAAARSPSLGSVTGGGRWRQPGFHSQRLAQWCVVTTGRRRVVTTQWVGARCWRGWVAAARPFFFTPGAACLSCGQRQHFRWPCPLAGAAMGSYSDPAQVSPCLAAAGLQEIRPAWAPTKAGRAMRSRASGGLTQPTAAPSCAIRSGIATSVAALSRKTLNDGAGDLSALRTRAGHSSKGQSSDPVQK